ncbi:MAG: hypothetical protein ACK4RK_09920 [Gemmataceae bacterium]
MADAVSTIATPVEPGPKLPDVQLIETDGMPLESDWHRDAINLLIEQIRYHLRDRRITGWCGKRTVVTRT